jgi:formylmethanofuran dehydrogenase subunit E-like metal-binding protein
MEGKASTYWKNKDKRESCNKGIVGMFVWWSQKYDKGILVILSASEKKVRDPPTVMLGLEGWPEKIHSTG